MVSLCSHVCPAHCPPFFPFPLPPKVVVSIRAAPISPGDLFNVKMGASPYAVRQPLPPLLVVIVARPPSPLTAHPARPAPLFCFRSLRRTR